MGDRALLYVFPEKNVWSNTVDIPIEKRNGSWNAFAQEVKQLKELIHAIEKR